MTFLYQIGNAEKRQKDDARVKSKWTFSNHETTFSSVTDYQLLKPGFQTGMWWCTAATVASGRLGQSHGLRGSLCDTLKACGWRDGRVGGLRVCEWVEGEKEADRSHHLRIYTSQTFVYDCMFLWTKRAARRTVLYFPRVSLEYKTINQEMLGKYSDFPKVLYLRGLLARSSWVTNTHDLSKTTPQKNKIPDNP